MAITFIILAVLAAASAIAAMTMRNLIHCALALVVTFASLAGVYLQLNAQFVGFAQILVYVGAVTILILFAILLTRGSEVSQRPVVSSGWVAGVLIALSVFVLLSGALLSSKALVRELPPVSQPTVRQIGDQLMTRYVLPLEVLGLLLTAAMIGAVIIALKEKPDSSEDKDAGGEQTSNSTQSDRHIPLTAPDSPSVQKSP
ncbi:MAG TPA: NADH-quinone oxidoreductase subunit J [Clostridia bacterium]|nr:NADH-quinone oxidoreductase subunit J [Clostridia bacterium]